jgi:exopolyphosphatase/guanosine-5'-triphosphate,3'-diphosphate pyrophosphatase
MISLNGISGKINRVQNSNPERQTLAVVDAGTNTFRLLIFTPSIHGIINPLAIEQKIVRLGENFSNTGKISEMAQKRAIDTLKEFISIAKKHDVSGIYVAGTSIFREAENRDAFIEKVWEETGIKINVLSPEEEARMSVSGCVKCLKNNKRILLVDIGGGSTEFVLWGNNEIKFLQSVSLGVVHLTEGIIKTDPPLKEELNKMERIIEKKIKRIYNKLIKVDKTLDFELTGTAGTITTIGAILSGMRDYDRRKINMVNIQESKLRALYQNLVQMKSKDRANIPGIVRGREDLIVPGMAIVIKVMEIFKKKIMKISDYGLLEGIAIHYLNKRGGVV